MRKIVVSALSAVLALALCGCAASGPATDEAQPQGATPPSEESQDNAQQAESSGPSERKPLEVSESGYWVDRIGSQHFAVIVDNPNSDWAAQFAEVTIKGVDADGATVGTSSAFASLIFPEGKVAVCGTASIEGAEDLEFSVNAADHNWTSDVDGITQKDWDSLLYVDSVKETEGEHNNVVIAGDVVNDTDSEMGSVFVNLVLRDGSGAIVGGELAVISTLSPQSDAPFSCNISYPPDYATVDASASPTSIS